MSDKKIEKETNSLEDEKIPFHRNPAILAIIFQVALLGGIAWLALYFYGNTQANLAQRGILVGLHFLNVVADFKPGFTAFWNFEQGVSQYWEIFIIGMQNTILVSVLGIIAATFLGFTIGVLRLSNNWLARKFAHFYIEAFRNIPLLLQIFFTYFVIILNVFPHRRESWTFFDAIYINKGGFYFPQIELNSTFIGVIILATIVISGFLISYWREWTTRQHDETGKIYPVFSVSVLIAIIGLIIIYFTVKYNSDIAMPRVTKLRIRDASWVPIPLFSLWLSLSLYTAAFIAENVRGGIQSVNKGQIEAAGALGLGRRRVLKLVLIPQAMRVIIPPTISQFLNLIKNSSLAVAIGYDDIVNLWMGVTLNQTGQSLVIIAMTMLFYTVINFATSIIMNVYNKKMALVER